MLIQLWGAQSVLTTLNPKYKSIVTVVIHRYTHLGIHRLRGMFWGDHLSLAYRVMDIAKLTMKTITDPVTIASKRV